MGLRWKCPIGNRKYEFSAWKAVLGWHQQALEAYSTENGRSGRLRSSIRHCHRFLFGFFGGGFFAVRGPLILASMEITDIVISQQSDHDISKYYCTSLYFKTSLFIRTSAQFCFLIHL